MNLFYPAASILADPEIMEVLSILSTEEDLQVNLGESSKGALVTGLSTLIGGIMLGPRGLALGGALGGLAAYGMSQDFKPVSQIICEMSEEKKDLLCRKVKRILRNVAVSSGPLLLKYIQKHPIVYNEIIDIVKSFVITELGMSLKPV